MIFNVDPTDHIQLTIHEYREQLYQLIVSKRTNVCRLQHDKPLVKMAVDEPPPLAVPSNGSMGQASPQPATTPTPTQPRPSASAINEAYGRSPSGLTTPLKRRPETMASSTAQHYAPNGLQDQQHSTATAVRYRPRRGSSSNAPPLNSNSGNIVSNDNSEMVKRSASQSNGLVSAASTSAYYTQTAGSGGVMSKSTSGSLGMQRLTAAAQARRLSAGSQTFAEDPRRSVGVYNGDSHYNQMSCRKNGFTNGLVSAIVPHRQSSTKPSMYTGGGGRRNSKCYPHMTDERCAPIAMAECR